MVSVKGGLGWLLFALYVGFPAHECVDRKYYIGISEETWNYAPSGKNLINGKTIAEDEGASAYLLQSHDRIGTTYKKALYKQYTDGTYSRESPRPSWLGYLGPLLKAEVDDTIIIHLRNFASRAYSMHPHGVFYRKDSEGALYPDGTSGHLKEDDAVPPGGNHTYRWTVLPGYAPAAGDADCLTWMYHSHVNAPRDISSGLIGGLLTCRKGILQNTSSSNSEPQRSDVDKDFFIMFSVVDENLSWYLEENIQTFCSNSSEVDPNNEDFQESNRMHAINGGLFGNLPGIEVCLNQTVSWHLVGMGNEVDIHSAYFYGHTLLNQGHRVDTISLFPASLITASMIPRTAGKWMLSCQVNDHIKAGMQAFYQVSSCGRGAVNGTAPPPTGRTRHYYIAAEEQLWAYAPSGMDTFHNQLLNKSGSHSEMFFGKTEGRLGGVYQKVRYMAYTDETFTMKKNLTNAEKHLGILGPVISAELGDLVYVTFMNKASRNYSIQSHGLQYDKEYEGSVYSEDTLKPGASVRPGDKFTYQWKVVEGPSPSDPQCLSYLYHSASDPVRDTNSGLMGPLLVCKKDALYANNSQKGVDKEFFLLFTVMDENLSWYLEDNIRKFGNNESRPEDQTFMESNKMHAVNGFMYGNLPGLDPCTGDRVSWHALGVGSEVDIHGVYFQGNTFQRQGTTRDTLGLFPHTAVTVAMVPDSAGTFEVSCRTSHHYISGMRQKYSVKRCTEQDSSPIIAPPTVQVFIAAEELVWDYSPDRTWELEKHNASEENSPGSIFVGKGENRIGPQYKKVVYREYTDATFRTRKARQPKEDHLEILGPIIRVEVGERLLINFQNKASRPYSIYAHGVVVVNTQHEASTQPGRMGQYVWNIPERTGPGVSDPNCISFAYYSSVDFVKDTISGLIGPLVVCRKGTLDKNRGRKDVDQELAVLFMVFDENMSWYLRDNIQTYLNRDPDNFTMNAEFEEGNKMHAINGKLYGNLHGLVMTTGEMTDWYLLGMGNEVDVHTVHFHGETFTYKTDQAHRSDVYDLVPVTFQTVEMTAGNPGTWLLHCHVADHIHAGMETTFTVRSRTGGNSSQNAATSLIQGFMGVTLSSVLGLELLVLALH